MHNIEQLFFITMIKLTSHFVESCPFHQSNRVRSSLLRSPLRRVESVINNQCNSIQFYSHFYKIFTLYIVRQEYTNKEEGDGKKEINGLDKSVRWSGELSFRANHHSSVSTQRKRSQIFLWFNFPSFFSFIEQRGK